MKSYAHGKTDDQTYKNNGDIVTHTLVALVEIAFFKIIS